MTDEKKKKTGATPRKYDEAFKQEAVHLAQRLLRLAQAKAIETRRAKPTAQS